MRKNEPIKCYGFIMGYYRSFMHTLRNPKDHTISNRLGVEEQWRRLSTKKDVILKTSSQVDYCVPCTENPATGNKTMTLPVSACNAGESFSSLVSKLPPCPLVHLHLVLYASLASCSHQLPLQSFSCHSHLLEIFQTKSEYSQFCSFDSAMSFLSLIEAIALYGLILMHLY